MIWENSFSQINYCNFVGGANLEIAQNCQRKVAITTTQSSVELSNLNGKYFSIYQPNKTGQFDLVFAEWSNNKQKQLLINCKNCNHQQNKSTRFEPQENGKKPFSIQQSRNYNLTGVIYSHSIKICT